MSSILRIAGEHLDIHGLLSHISMSPRTAWKNGEKKFATRKGGPYYQHSGANFLVSEADFDDFEQQKTDAVAFLQHHAHDIRTIVSWPKCAEVSLDFEIYSRDVAVQCHAFQPELLVLCGSLGVWIELSLYPDDQ